MPCSNALRVLPGNRQMPLDEQSVFNLCSVCGNQSIAGCSNHACEHLLKNAGFALGRLALAGPAR